MIARTFFLCCAFFAVCFAVVPEARIEALNSPLTTGAANRAQIDRALEIVEETGCEPNLCFAIDGSSSITDDEFQLQLDFVALITGLVSLDEQSGYSAIQYGLRPKFMSRFTQDAAAFLLKVEGTRQLRSVRTFIAPGIGGCMRQFRRVRGQANKIILLGDGRSTFDSRDPPLDPPSIAAQFLAEPNNSICAVGVSFDTTELLEEITGDPDRVFSVADWMSVVDVLADLVEQVCGADAVEF
ncbi:hypothetical protein BWQ96_05239 [Gracilariopsis chorda]|uniref:VWFA domain-containing protein n=1 Tax=Gracilariopsis chorda TaxID=448386 RepID=A0A2V3ISA4_9FLOR|nr:hypothetical protein BWQ96_05239 [Gracilariopsis chorda]|eukprot:PXF44992.1 hypothetical protein BWQ96_05239 [Gracilariopsis chorda]